MSFQHALGNFTVRSGTGTQTITGVGFTPKVVWFFSSSTAAAADDYAVFFTGFDDGTTAWGMGLDVVDNDTPPQKVASGSFVGSSLVRVNASALTPDLMFAAHISAMNSDGFVLTVTINSFSQSEYVHFVAFGGSDFEYDLATFAPTTGTQTISGLSIAPKALIAFELGTTGAVGVGGGLAVTYVGETGLCSLATYDASRTPTSQCQRYLRNGRAFTAVTQGNSQVVVREADSVSFTSDGFVVHWSTALATPSLQAVLALGGSVSGSAAGVLVTETTATTQVTTVPAINPVVVVFGSVSHATSATVQLDMSHMLGAADGTAAGVSAWAGCLDNVGTSVAAKGQTTADAIYATTAANPGSSSAVHALAALTSLATSSFTMTYSLSGVGSPAAVDVMYLALGTTAVPPPIPTGTTYPIRRVRIFTLQSDLNFRMFLQRLEVLVQAGVGLTGGQGVDPTFTVRISRDGGMTYGVAYVLTPGRLGDYAHRSFLTRLGWYRNATVEIAMSDPVLWAILDAFGDLERGAN